MNPFKVPSRALTLNRVPASRRQTPASGNNKANSPASAYNKANKDILAPDNNRANSSSSLQEDHIDDSVINSNMFTTQEFKLSTEQLLRQEGYAQQTKDIDNYFERILNPQDKKSDGIITAEMITNPQVVAAYMKFKEEGNDLLKKMKRVKEFKDLDTDTEIVNLEVEVDKYKFINIKSYKHIIENFLHTLTQNDIPLWTYGPVFQSDTPLIHFIKTEFGFYKIGTISKSTNMRILWGQALLSLLMLEFIDTVQRYSVIDFQMESPKQPVEDTLPETEVTKVAQNTIITQEQDDTTNVHIEENSNLLQEISTTEQLSNLAPIAERFVRIFDSTQVFNITDTFNQQIFSLTIPNGLYAHLDSTIVSALRSFTLLKTDVELLVKINANQAQCGRYIMSHFPRYDMINLNNTLYDNVLRMVQRDHAVVDISKSDDISYTIHYENTIPWLPIQTDEVGTVTGGSFATVRMRCLSPLRIADSGNPICPFQVFARLKNTVLSGMRYPLPLNTPGTTIGRNETAITFQMENPSRTENVLKNTVSVIKEIPVIGNLFGIAGRIMGRGSLALAHMFNVNQEKIKLAEDRLKYIGMINKDRPIDISHPQPLLPMPVHCYSHGRGPYSSKKLRLQPEATTPHLEPHKTVNDTTNINELAQIPGLVGRFMVSTTNKQGDLLYELPACPFDPRYINLYPAVSTAFQPPPVTYFSFMYNFYSGSLVYEFVPVKTPAHNFSIQVGFVPFNGTPDTVTEAQLQSCRWKVLDFRTSQNGQFTTPWLSNRVMRNKPVSTISFASSDNDFQNSNQGVRNVNLRFKDPGKVVVRLVNELNPTPIVSPTIEVLVFVKAHPNFRYFSPTNMLPASQAFNPTITQFVRQYGTPPNFGEAVIPTYFTGNFDQTMIRYEMETSKLQDGDEQTLYGDSLRDAPGPQVQGMEDHGNILDICRRFYLHATYTGIFSRRQGAETTLPYPPFSCMPLTISAYQPLPAFSTPNQTRTRNMPNPRDSILACFRWFRGSMNYVIHSLTDIPLEVTYLPAVDFPYSISSVRTENVDNVFHTSNTDIPIFATPVNIGLPTEVIEPRLNPILTVEVPMYNANNYVDVLGAFSGDAFWSEDTRNRRYNEINNLTSLYLGNLVIRGVNGQVLPLDQAMNQNFKVRVLSAFGDDAQFHHFIGCPPLNRNAVGLRWDVVGTTTTFFNENKEIDVKDRVRSSQEIETQLIAEGIEANPGPVCSKVSDFFSKGLTSTFSSIAGLSSDLKNLISQPKHLASTFEDAKIKGLTMLEQIKQVLHLYTNGIDTLQITSLALTLISVFKDSSNVYSLLSALCQILSITGVFHVEAVANAMSKFSLLFSNNDENKEGVKHQMDNQSWTTVAAIFSSILMETFFAYRSVNESKFNVDESYVKQVMIQTFKNFNVMRSGALCILMSRVCKAFEFLYTNARKWIRGLEKYDILADDPKFIQNFMIDYEFFMDERNLSSQSMIQRHRDRFWTTVLTAYYLKSVLATVDKKYINTTLQAAVREVILKANSLKSHMSAPPVRYEPFCVWYYGEPGTGKTTMMQNHLIDMTKNIKCTYNADPIYVRSPHSQWWNGYDNQPIVMIDDANGVNDPTILGRMVSEFQAMKTSAKMRLEMPRLEEKNAEMTSIVLGICSNVKEWTSTMIVDQQAFRRRRDIVVEVLYSSKAKEFFNKQPNLMKAVSSLPKALVEANEHVKFKVLHNPSSGQENGIEMEYEEFCKHLLSIHEKYHTQEIEKMFARYQKSLSLSKTLAGDIMDQSSLKTALLAVILGCESTEVMAETMKRQLYELKQVTPERFNALPKHTQSLLNKMSTLPVHQAPAVANSTDLHQNYNNSSHWFRNEFMPNFQIGNFYQRTKQRYAPWSYNDIMTVDTDMITSPCAVCNSLPSNQNHLYKMCGNSVEENQHWICTECAQGFDLQNSINCPVCREEKLIQFNNDQRHWRWYAKLQHIAHEVIKDFKTPLVMTAKILWENARTIMLTSLIFGLLARSLVLTYQMIKEIQLESIAEQQVQRFVGVFGVLPNSVRYIGDTIYLTAGQNTFVERNENGVYSYSIVNDSVYYEMGKKSKSEPRSTTSSIPDVKYYSAASSDDEEKIPSIPLKFEPLNIDVMKLLPPVQCTEVHGETSLDILKNPNLKYNVGYSDKKFIVNIRETGKEVSTLEIPYTRCIEANCKFNGIMNKVAQKYYLARYKIWQDAMLEGEDISDIEDEVPQEMVHAVEEMVDRPLETPKPLYLRFIDYQKSLLLALKGILMSWYQTIYDAICNKWKYILGILTLAFATYFGIKYYYSDEDGITLEPEHQGSGEHKTGRNHSKLNTARTRTLVRGKRTQHEMKISLSTQVPINIQNIRDLIFKNRFVMSCCGTNVYSFAIMNNYGLLPRHAFYYFAKLQEMGQPIVFQQGDVKEIIKDRITLHCVEDNVLGEYVIFQFKRLIGKDIRHHFYSTIHEEITYPSYAYGIDLKDQVARPVQVVDVKQYDLDKYPLEDAPTVSTTWTTNVEGKEEDFKYESKLTTYLIISNFYGDGKCGSPIVNSEGKIIGVHFAGQYIAGNSYGYSYPVFTDDFMGLTVMGTTQENKVEHQMESFPNLEFYSHYPNAPFHTDTSRIHPSAIAEKAWESVTEPCIQSNSDPRYVHGNSPLYDGATTIGAVTNPPIPDILNEAIHAVSQELIQNMSTPAMKVPVSQEEAVSAANHQFVRAMNLASSAGLPLIVDNPGKNLKSDYIENKINSDGTSTVTFTPEFQKLYDINWSMRLAGTVPEDPYWAHLKDERRKPEKARSFGGTRVFSVSPLELVVSSRRVLLPMMDAFHSDPIRLHHAIGLSTESIAWSEMIETLRAKSHLIIQLDFSKFSDSMPWEFVQGAFQVISNYYETYGLLTPEIENLLKTLEHNITRSLICIGRYIYRVKNGVLQGHPLTSLINSIVNLIEQTYVWIKITGLTGSEFFRYCGIVVMGDDVVISVPRQILKRYNGKTIANAFLEMNIVVTDENKNKEEIIPYQNISRFDFLSCSYKLHPYRYLYLAPADISSIFDTALWISRKDGPFFDATLENVEQSLNNSFGHGPCIYEIYRAVLQFLTGSRFRSWFELDMIFYGSKGLPERSIIATNLGIVTGTSPKVLELLGAGTGRIERVSKSERNSQYWNADFLSVALLDTQGIVTGKYRCDCRYNCERELLMRVAQVEQRTGVPREHFLPFTTQEEGTGILGQPISRRADSRGSTSTIAFNRFVGVPSDSAVGEIDGMRDRVQEMEIL